MIERLVAEVEATSEQARRLLGGHRPEAVRLASRWEGRSVWAVFGRRGRWPAIYVKADHDARSMARLEREHRALQALRERPELAATVPEPLALLRSGRRLVLAQTALPGLPLTTRQWQRLRQTPRRCARDHELVLGWLARFQERADGSTRLEPAAVMERAEAALPRGRRRFLRRLSRMAEGWSGLELPLVPAHGDLSPSNCVIDGDRVGIVDWDGAEERRPPLPELVFFLLHYVRLQPDRAHRLRAPLPAFRLAFLGDGWQAELTARSLRLHLERLGLPADAAGYLLAVTLVELAAGERRAARFWRPLLREYAAHRRS